MPDIEFRLYESTKPKLRGKIDSDDKNISDKTNCDNGTEYEEIDEENDDCDILDRLSRIVEKNGYVCTPRCEQNVRL